MESQSLDALQPDPMNPQFMVEHDVKSLDRSMNYFGDLSPIIRNVRTTQLVGGHKRIDRIKKAGKHADFVITQRFSEPDEVGTTGWGFVRVGNIQFTYREVDWPIEKQRAANIAANRIHGEFDNDKLAQIDYELSQLSNGLELMEATGLTKAEHDRLLDSTGATDGGNDKPKEPQLLVCPQCGHGGEWKEFKAD